MSYEIFISHASADKFLANNCKKMLKRCFPDVSIFCSTDSGCIEGGAPWFDKIMTAIKETKVTLCLLTPNSIYRPWVLFESGGAYSLHKSNSKSRCLIPACAMGISEVNLSNGPFKQLQVRKLVEPAEVTSLIKQIGSVLGRPIKEISQTNINKLCKLAQGPETWEGIHQSLLGDRLDSTPFNVETLLSLAESHFFTAGPNLLYLATSKPCRNALFDWLKKPSRRASIMLCDPENKEELKVWTAVGHTFERDLTTAYSNFHEWCKEAKKIKINDRLDIRVTKLITTGFMAIDPEDKRGKVVVTPIVVGKRISGERPHIVLNRSNDLRAYDHYWEAYWDTFMHAKRIV